MSLNDNPRTDLQTILDKLHQTGDWEEREAALVRLIGSAEQIRLVVDQSAIVEHILPHAADWNERVRARTMEALGTLPQAGAGAVEALCCGMADHDESVRIAASASLVANTMHNDDSVIDRLLQLFADGRAEVRELALVGVLSMPT